MSRRRRIQTDVPETEDPDGCPRDGGSRQKSPRRTTRADWHRECPWDGRSRWVGPSILAFRLRDIHVCHLPWPYVWRRMSQTDVPETDDRDGGLGRMQQTESPRPKDGGKVCVCFCVSTCVFYCLSVCLSVCRWVGRSVFYCDVVYIMSFDLIQFISFLSCYLFTFSSSSFSSSSNSFLRWPQSSWWLLLHFRRCSQSPHISSGHKSL